MRRYTRRVNGLALRFAGRVALADLEHVGRTSGRTRHTPVRAFRSGDQVVIGVNFGVNSDWLKNIQAAGRCRIRLKRDLLDLGGPELISLDDAIPAMPALFGLALRYLVRTEHVVRMPVLSSGPATGTADGSTPRHAQRTAVPAAVRQLLCHGRERPTHRRG